MTDKGQSNLGERIWDGIFYVGIALVFAALSYGFILYMHRK